MKKLKIYKNQILDQIPDDKDELVKQNVRLRHQNEFLRNLLGSHDIRIPESMDDYLETRELEFDKDSYIVGKLESINDSLSMLNQLLTDIKMNMK